MRPSIPGETVPAAAMLSITCPAVSPPDLESISTSPERSAA